jgi:hypothetical protein
VRSSRSSASIRSVSPWRVAATSRPMPESAAKRKLRRNQTVLSGKVLAAAGAGRVMACGASPQAAARSSMQAALRLGSALSSAKTAPDSTADSWSWSPSNTMRAPSGTASKRRVASARSSIEASSTTSTSSAKGRPAWWAKPEGEAPSRRCTVEAASGSPSRRACGRPAARSLRASCKRAAALPVGAASRMRQAGFCTSRQASSCTTVVVLPVPGPPLITVRCWRSASAAASFCPSTDPGVRGKLDASCSMAACEIACGAWREARSSLRARRCSRSKSRCR